MYQERIFFFIYFTTISLLFIGLKKFLNNIIILSNIIKSSQKFLCIFAIYDKYQINKISHLIINERKKSKQFKLILLLISFIIFTINHLYLHQFSNQLNYQELLYSSFISLDKDKL